MLDAYAVRSSGAGASCNGAVDDKFHNGLSRDVLYVRSLSEWAPVCIGPYSQSNTIRAGGVCMSFVAGQIPLVPGTMQLMGHPNGAVEAEKLGREADLCIVHAKRTRLLCIFVGARGYSSRVCE